LIIISVVSESKGKKRKGKSAEAWRRYGSDLDVDRGKE